MLLIDSNYILIANTSFQSILLVQLFPSSLPHKFIIFSMLGLSIVRPWLLLQYLICGFVSLPYYIFNQCNWAHSTVPTILKHKMWVRNAKKSFNLSAILHLVLFIRKIDVFNQGLQTLQIPFLFKRKLDTLKTFQFSGTARAVAMSGEKRKSAQPYLT